MAQTNSENDSDSDGSTSPQHLAATPGYSLEHSSRSNNRSDNSENELQIDDRSDGRSVSPYSQRSPSGSPQSHSSKSRSASPVNGNESSVRLSTSRSPSGSPKITTPTQDESHQSRSRSRSAGSRSSVGSARSRSSGSGCSNSGSRHFRSESRESEKKGSGNNAVISASRHSSPSQKSTHSNSRSRSPISRRSRSATHSRSGSRHSSRSKSGTDGSRSLSKDRSHSVSRVRSGSPGVLSRSGSCSDSDARSPNGSRERSQSTENMVSTNKRSRVVVSESGSETEKTMKKKRSALIDSESDDEVKQSMDGSENVDAGALFGDADDISTDDEVTQTAAKRASSEEKDERMDSDRDSNRRHDSDRRSTGGSEDEREKVDEEPEKEVEAEPEPIPERRIDVEIPRIVTDLGKEIHFVKLPNFLSVDTRPFDPDTYEDEIDEEETLDEEGRQRIKLKVSNTIRWREYMNSFGAMVRESNARMTKWSDGSMSLHLGNEIFDVYKQSLHGDHNHLFIRQGTGLQGQAVFRSKLTFRPHSTESFTHKKMTMSLADRSQKTSGIKILTQVGHDPDSDRMQNLKKEEEKLRQAMRQKSNSTKPKRGRDTSSNVNASYREDGDHESEDEGAISISAIKNKYRKAPVGNAVKPGAAIYSSDEEDSDLDTRRIKKTDKTKVAKALRESDEEDDDSGGDGGGGGGDDRSGYGSDINDKEKYSSRTNQIQESDGDD